MTTLLMVGDALGDPLSEVFSSQQRWEFTAGVPPFRTGKVPFDAPAVPFTDPGFIWTAGYVHNTPSPQNPAYVPPGNPLPGMSWLSGELAVYPNGDAITAIGKSPISSDGKSLVFTASLIPPDAAAYIPTGDVTAAGTPPPYWSGAISSYPYGQTYGYFEIMAKIPAGRGLWPAFWLLPVDGTWPPEIDVMEILGQDPTTMYATLHDPSYHTSTNNSTQLGATGQIVALRESVGPSVACDLSLDYHAYGMDWGPNAIRFYLDHRLIASMPTPANMHKPFYVMANLAVGGPSSWPGAPDGTTVFPACMHIASIRAAQRKAYLSS